MSLLIYCQREFKRAFAVVCLVLVFSATIYADGFENVRLRLVNGSSIRATIDSINESGDIVGSDILKGINLSEIIGIDLGRTVRKSKFFATVELKLGGTVAVTELLIEEELVKVVRDGNAATLPLEVVRAVIWKTSPFVKKAIEQPSSKHDSIIVTTSRGEKTVHGLIDSVNETHVALIYEGKSKRISLDKVMAIVTADLNEKDPVGALANVSLTDGSTVFGVIRSYNGGKLNLGVSQSHDLLFAANEISNISVQSDRVVYLSDIEPDRVEEQSQFAAARQWQRDSSLLGKPIRLKYSSSGRILSFEKGIGTRSYTSLVFSNRKNFSHLRAIVGIDMETMGHGDCEMVVEGDGIRLWSERIRAGDDPKPMVVAIDGIDEIALIVFPGENFDLADHADWADARFTRSN